MPQGNISRRRHIAYGVYIANSQNLYRRVRSRCVLRCRETARRVGDAAPYNGSRVYLLKPKKAFPWGKGDHRRWWMRETYSAVFMGYDTNFIFCKFAVSHGSSRAPTPTMVQYILCTAVGGCVAARQHIAPQAYHIRSIYRKFAEFISQGA